MRMIVIAFALLAGFKVWTQDRFYRSAMSDALIQAYRERAQQVCQKEGAKTSKAAVGAWTMAPEVMIGSPLPSVALWDVDNPLWNVRYRHPHIILTAVSTTSGSAKTTCAYDLMVGLASFSAR